MSLTEKITADMKEAMKAKDQVTLRGVRAIKSAIMLLLTEAGAAKELTEDQELQVLQKLVKTRRDSLDIYKQQNREDLAAKELEEIEVIERYLPKQLSDEEVAAIIEEIVAEAGANSMKDMGKVMGMASKRLAGKADNRKISEMVKAKLNA